MSGLRSPEWALEHEIVSHLLPEAPDVSALGSWPRWLTRLIVGGSVQDVRRSMAAQPGRLVVIHTDQIRDLLIRAEGCGGAR